MTTCLLVCLVLAAPLTGRMADEVTRAEGLADASQDRAAYDLLLEALPRATGDAHAKAHELLQDVRHDLAQQVREAAEQARFAADLAATEPGTVADEVERQDRRAMVYLLHASGDEAPAQLGAALEECRRSELRPAVELYAAGYEQVRSPMIGDELAPETLEPLRRFEAQHRDSLLGESAATALAAWHAGHEEYAEAFALLEPYLAPRRAERYPAAVAAHLRLLTLHGSSLDREAPARDQFSLVIDELLSAVVESRDWPLLDRVLKSAEDAPLDSWQREAPDFLRWLRTTEPEVLADWLAVISADFMDLDSDGLKPFAQAHPRSALAPVALWLAEDLATLAERYPDHLCTSLARAAALEAAAPREALALYEAAGPRLASLPAPLRAWLDDFRYQPQELAERLADEDWLNQAAAPELARLTAPERQRVVGLLAESWDRRTWSALDESYGERARPLLHWAAGLPNAELSWPARAVIASGSGIGGDPDEGLPEIELTLEDLLPSVEQAGPADLVALRERLRQTCQWHTPMRDIWTSVDELADRYAGQPAAAFIRLTYADVLRTAGWLEESLAAYEQVAPGPFAAAAAAGRAQAVSELQARQREPLQPVVSVPCWPDQTWAPPVAPGSASLLGDTLVWLTPQGKHAPLLAAYRRSDLRRVWELRRAPARSRAAYGDRLLLGDDRQVEAYGADGRRLWQVEPLPGSVGRPCEVALYGDGALVLCAGVVQRRDADTGELVWERELGPVPPGAPCRSGGVVCVAVVEPARRGDGTLLGLDWATGAVRWRQDWELPRRDPDASVYEGRRPPRQPRTADDGRLLVEIADHSGTSLRAYDEDGPWFEVDPASGACQPTLPPPSPVEYRFAATGRFDLGPGPAWVIHGQELLACRADGTVVRTGALPAPALMLAGDEHELFVLDSMGMIHQYRLEP